MKAIFWGAAGLVFYAYLGYSAWLWVWRRRGLDIGKIRVEGQRTLLVSAAQLRAVNRAGRVVKIVKYDRAAELAVVEQVLSQLAERVPGDLPSRDELPREAHVEVVIAFDFLGIVLLIERSVGGEFEFFNCCRRNVLQRGRHEITRITDVHRSGIVDLPDQIGARTDLLLVVERNIKTVITQAVVQGQVIGQLPFVLQVNAGGQPTVSTIGGYREWSG